MEVEFVDTELFINEVEKRRCIWDMKCPDYKNKVFKKSAWQKIMDIFAGTENSFRNYLAEKCSRLLWKGTKEDDHNLFCTSLYTELQKVPEHGRIHTKVHLLEVIRRAQEFYNPSHIHPAPQSYQSYPPPQTYKSAKKQTSTNTRKLLQAHRLQQPLTSSEF